MMGNSVATTTKEVADNLGGLERVDARLEELAPQEYKVSRRELFNVGAVIAIGNSRPPLIYLD